MSRTTNGIEYQIVHEGSGMSLFLFPDYSHSLTAVSAALKELKELYGNSVHVRIDAVKGQEMRLKAVLQKSGYLPFNPTKTKKPYILVHPEIITATGEELDQYVTFLRNLAEQLKIVSKNMSAFDSKSLNKIRELL